MKDFEKKQGVGVAKEPRRNIKILGLRLHYRFGNHVLQIPSNCFHSSAFHKRFSHGYLTRKLLCENLHPVWGTMPQNVLLNFSHLPDGIPQRKNSL